MNATHSFKSVSFAFLFISTFLIYIDFGLGIDTLPVLVVAFSVVFLCIERFRLVLSVDTLATFLLISVILVYLAIGVGTYGVKFSVIEAGKYLFGPLFYLVIRNSAWQVTRLVLWIVMALFFLYGFLYFMLGNEWVNTELFFSARAVNRFSPLVKEPSYFANFSMVLLVYGVALVRKRNFSFEFSDSSLKFTVSSDLLFVLFTIFLGFLTASIYVYLVVFAFIFSRVFYLKRPILYILLFSLVFVVLGWLLLRSGEFSPGSRIGNLLIAFQRLLNGDIGFLEFANYAEPSGTTRLILNAYAISIPFEGHAFGFGLGGFFGNWEVIQQFWDVDFTQHSVLSLSSSFYAQTYFCNLISVLGIFAYIFWVVVFSSNAKFSDLSPQQRSNFIFILTCVLLMSLFQGQITNPALWFLIAVLKRENFHRTYDTIE